MAYFDESKRQLTLRMVYYGPAQSGKSACLQALHRQLAPQFKGELYSLDDDQGATLFLDTLSLGFQASSDLLIRCQLVAVPGALLYNSTRQLLIKDADGVLFVADSCDAARSDNAGAYANLQRNCQQVGVEFEQLPLVIQYNKRDLDAIVPMAELSRSWAGKDLFFSSAIGGEGVVEPLVALLRMVYQRIDSVLLPNLQIGEPAFIQGLTGERDREVIDASA